ncbi:MAG: hypothetical protein ACK520_11855 [Inhella sp.]|uniref:hypothetical protein n=1 Tax=Inhella sp. TaxID=1921806 RepID=UPI0022BB6F9D|nr:hypothetical protein [Inhella sp.]MCZ8233626.1 hypothetical protein [Inhella sp.]
MTMVLTGAASAQVPDAEMARCAAITDGAARLRCLDALAAGSVARLQAGTVAPAAPTAAAAVAAAPSPSDLAASMGLPPPKVAEPDRIDSQIEGRVEGWGPNTHFRLKNGQVWRVSDGSTGDLGLTDPKVTIRRNRFGTYFLEFEGRNDSPKVRRVS